MLWLVTYRKQKTVFLAKETGIPEQYVILKRISGPTHKSHIKRGHITTRGKKDNIKVFTPIDTEEKLGEYLLSYEL